MITVPEIALKPLGHKIADGVETYSFAAALNPHQRHELNRVNDDPWTIGPADMPDELSLAQMRIFTAEMDGIARFADQLTARVDDAQEYLFCSTCSNTLAVTEETFFVAAAAWALTFERGRVVAVGCPACQADREVTA